MSRAVAAGFALCVLWTLACGGEAPPAQDAPPAEPVFAERATETGLVFHHTNGMSGEFYICEVKCAGCGLLDYDNDGDLDVYLIQGAMLGEGKTLADATAQLQKHLRKYGINTSSEVQ